MDIFLRGLVIGFSIAAPVGPIGMLCIQRTLAEGRLSGFLSGLGAATADAFYGAVAAFGLTFLEKFLINQQTWLRLIGGVFLIWLGIRTILRKATRKTADINRTNPFGAYFSTVLLTLTNPMTIITFTAIFASINLDTGGTYGSAGLLVFGVFLGSAAWWLSLSLGIGLLRNRSNDQIIVWVNRLAGIIIIAFGIYSIGSSRIP